MKRMSNYLIGFAIVLCGLAGGPAAYAQATRTWVSGVGDDANPCSRTAPCKTFAGAISKSAVGGEINAIDPGGFGAVTITKSITIDGGGTMAGILNAGTNGVVVSGAGIKVTLRNLVFDGAGTGLTGIKILTASRVSVENCQIFGNNGKGIDDQRIDNNVALHVSDTIIRNNTATGILVRPASGNTNTIDASLHRLIIFGNGGAGVTASTGSNVRLTDSVISGNVNGVYVEEPAGATTLFVADTTVSNNGVGLAVGGGAPVVHLSNTAIVDNDLGVNPGGISIVSYGNNKIHGNAAGNGPYVPAMTLTGMQ